MFLTCVLEIPNLLSLNVTLHLCKKIVNYNHYGMVQIVDWNKFSFFKYYKFVNVIAQVLANLWKLFKILWLL
jgi:hypothetical protein